MTPSGPIENAAWPAGLALRASWAWIVVAALVGAGMGAGAVLVRPRAFEATSVLSVALVGAKPFDPSSPVLVPVEAPSVVAAWLSQPETLGSVQGFDPAGALPVAWVEPSGLVGVRVTGPDEAGVADAVTGLGRLAQERHAESVAAYVKGLADVDAVLVKNLETAEGESRRGLERERLSVALHLARAREAQTTLLAPPSVVKAPRGLRMGVALGAALGFVLAWAWALVRGAGRSEVGGAT